MRIPSSRRPNIIKPPLLIKMLLHHFLSFFRPCLTTLGVAMSWRFLFLSQIIFILSMKVLLNHDPNGPIYQHGERMHLNRSLRKINMIFKMFLFFLKLPNAIHIFLEALQTYCNTLLMPRLQLSLKFDLLKCVAHPNVQMLLTTQSSG